jgi:phosphohistidine phosphatase
VPVELLLVRHADAGDPAAYPGPDDARPISAKGRRQAERLGAFLVDHGIRPDVILSSPKARAEQTARILAEALGMSVVLDERLASGFGTAELLELLAAHGDPRRPMLVGHDPDFSDLASTLCGTDVDLKKGALARIDFDGPPVAGSGRIRWLVPPDLLKAPSRHDPGA